jgi:hypothetical protein
MAGSQSQGRDETYRSLPWPASTSKKRPASADAPSSTDKHRDKRGRDGLSEAKEQVERARRRWPKAVRLVEKWHKAHDQGMEKTKGVEYAILQLERSKTKASSHHYWKDATRATRAIKA